MAYGDCTRQARQVKGKWRYSNYYSERLHPEKSHATDCSGFIRWVFKKVYGIVVGTWTGDEATYGKEIARGSDYKKIPWDKMKPDDVIFMSYRYDDYSFAHYDCHVELYTGNKRMIGAPGSPCPTEKDAVSWIVNYLSKGVHPRWMVRRFVSFKEPAKQTAYVDGTYKLLEPVHVRARRSRNSTSIAVLPKGTRIKLTSIKRNSSDNWWAKIKGGNYANFYMAVEFAGEVLMKKV